MARIKLSDPKVKKVAPPASGRTELWDSEVVGLGLRVTAAGSRSWFVRYRVGAKHRRFTLGDYPTLSLKNAREDAREALRNVRLGHDIQSERAAARKRSAPRKLSEELRDYVEMRRAGGMRSWRDLEGAFNREVIPILGQVGLEEVTDVDLLDLFGKIRSPSMANHSYAYLSAFFKWARGQMKIPTNPMTDLPRPRPDAIVNRDRFLSDAEIADFWRASNGLGYPFGEFFKLALLLGQRREEVSGMRREHVDLEKTLWEIPRELTKSNRAHLVPLPPEAMIILKAAPKFEGPYMFSTTAGDRPISGFSKAKKRLDIAIAEIRAERQADPLMAWRTHDLRRTVASGLARLKVPPIVVEKIQNRATGEGAGVAGIYNRYGYLDERRAALEAWGRYVSSIVKPGQGGAEIVSLQMGSR